MFLVLFARDVPNIAGGSPFSRVFARFRLSDQLRSSADQINDFGVVNVADPEIWVFWRLKYSHMCTLIGNVQGRLPPCCTGPVCDPSVCHPTPCCQHPPSHVKP
ncbi:hypothetical protein MTR_5g081340 [Medicago truncatula]|uniref:Uncharacterized protein n=1 Tax=Medicago truncatula TaxID=3880 RepID=G7K225_MEDTR|nr:hypothetical protein MTR_5g081340 [Medicago truncatula]